MRKCWILDPKRKNNQNIAGVDPGYVKRGAEIQKGGAGGWYNPKIAQK